MSLIKLTIKGISYSQTQTGAYALVLGEIDGARTLPIIIGSFEAQAIAIAIESEIKPPRPLTHDLFKTLGDKYQINITQVVIHKLIDGVFFSTLFCERDGIEETIDARTSDAIALAVRFDAPIFISESILDKAGIFLKLDDELNYEEPTTNLENEFEFELEDDSEYDTEDDTEDHSYNTVSLDELNEQLNTAIQDEDYELAAKLRDEINKRS